MTDIIPNPSEFIGKAVHVEGWKFACVFNLEKTDGKTHHLITPRTGKRYAKG